MSRSINHNVHHSALPDFRNLGILLRILLLVNGIALLATLVQAPDLPAVARQLTANAALVEPMLMLSLLTLAALDSWLRRLPYAAGIAAVLAIEAALTFALYELARDWLLTEPVSVARWLVLVLINASARPRWRSTWNSRACTPGRCAAGTASSTTLPERPARISCNARATPCSRRDSATLCPAAGTEPSAACATALAGRARC